MPKAKKFDKKKSVTFQLVHRSQQDPLVVDENAPQRVLIPVEAKESKKDKEKLLEEQHKYGIYYDDDSNYLDHLKDSKDNTMQWPEEADKKIQEIEVKKKLNLPSTVFASKVEEEIGMLAKAAPVSGPQLHLDPDVVAAMDDDFDYSDPENELEDNFIELANGVASDQEFNEEDYEVDSNFSGEMDNDVGSLEGSEKTFRNEETKSRFTNYSMTSSVMRRNEQLSLLDERFEKMYSGYEENEIGALETEEIEGHVPASSDILLQYAEEFEKSRQTEKIDKDKTNKLQQILESSDESDCELVDYAVPEKEKWDCESILSTYSNIYNHPMLIKEPKQSKLIINKKTGIPKNVLDSNKLTTAALNKLNEENEGYNNKGAMSMGGQSVISKLSTLSIRPKIETVEEKRERKKNLKEYRKERRLERKLNAEAFKEEAKRQVKISMNNRNNVQGNKIL